MQNPLPVLVVEDDYLVKELVEEALSEGGFEAQTVASAEEAIVLLQENHRRYRALITDVHLHGELTGWDVARRARELNLDLPVVYMTGDGADQWPSKGVPGSILLVKPFAPAQLVTAVSGLLNATPPIAPTE
ncbi:response regulator transcription factor [Bradyrhizobium sp. Ce-3]|uniref:response regulator transcription factor n=1 Tax=Bradyrhizobium sp. Ce-3 TaxID=2913970 RepID=UPI001FB8F2E4|nr:response regulator [Bradyrhizobium sp. Ce-3]